MEFIKNILAGAVIGVANIIPGISGGTMMVILNVFDKLVDSISNLRKRFKKSAMFLLSIGIGALAAILLLSKGVTYLLNNHYMITNFFFIGIIVGSIPMIYQKATCDKFKPLHVIPCIVTLIIMLITVFFIPDTSNEVIITTISVWSFVKLMATSALAAICMIIPGISGSFVMLLFGVYETITTALSSFNFPVLLPIVIGTLIGLVLGSKFIAFLLKRYPQATYFSILGFVLGSVPALFNKIYAEDAFVFGGGMAIAIAVLILGGIISYIFSSEKIKELIIEKANSRRKKQ